MLRMQRGGDHFREPPLRSTHCFRSSKVEIQTWKKMEVRKDILLRSDRKAIAGTVWSSYFCILSFICDTQLIVRQVAEGARNFTGVFYATVAAYLTSAAYLAAAVFSLMIFGFFVIAKKARSRLGTFYGISAHPSMRKLLCLSFCCGCCCRVPGAIASAGKRRPRAVLWPCCRHVRSALGFAWSWHLKNTRSTSDVARHA